MSKNSLSLQNDTSLLPYLQPLGALLVYLDPKEVQPLVIQVDVAEALHMSH